MRGKELFSLCLAWYTRSIPPGPRLRVPNLLLVIFLYRIPICLPVTFSDFFLLLSFYLTLFSFFSTLYSFMFLFFLHQLPLVSFLSLTFHLSLYLILYLLFVFSQLSSPSSPSSLAPTSSILSFIFIFIKLFI